MPKSDNNDLLKNDALLSLYADHMGLTPQFTMQYKDKLREIENKIYSSLRNTNNDDPSIRLNTMRVLQDITQRTYVADTYENDINELNPEILYQKINLAKLSLSIMVITPLF